MSYPESQLQQSLRTGRELFQTEMECEHGDFVLSGGLLTNLRDGKKRTQPELGSDGWETRDEFRIS